MIGLTHVNALGTLVHIAKTPFVATLKSHTSYTRCSMMWLLLNSKAQFSDAHQSEFHSFWKSNNNLGDRKFTKQAGHNELTVTQYAE